MVDLFNIASATAGGATAATSSAAKLAEDFDDFLTLLTTQLQNQDPLDPMDSNEFTQQLVAFSGVEQQIQTNQNLENLATLMSLDNLASTASFLGHNALIANAKGDHDGVSGIHWQYQNALETESLTLEVINDAGSLVYTQTGDPDFGLHDFHWPGIDQAGNAVPPGNYELRITAKNADNLPIDPAIAVIEEIKSVDTSAGQPLFQVGPNEVTQAQILQLIYGD